MTFLPIMATSFGLSALFSFFARKFFPQLGLMDRPEKYGHKRKPIPYPGGVALFATFMITLLIFVPVDATIRAVITGASMLAMTSFVDDRRGLSPFFRLAVQLLAAILLVMGGIGMNAISNPFGDPIALDAVNLPLSLGAWTFTITLFADLVTVIWVVVMINAFNWIDGFPGMTSGVSVVAALILLILSSSDFHHLDQSVSIALSSIILGMSLAFLFFDFPPPKMLMGDTGSMLLGFLLAVTAIISGGKIMTTVLILGFPILDFVWVILRRVFQGKSPFSGDLWHFHHRLSDAGLSDKGVVIFFSTTAAIFGSLSLVLQTEGKTWFLLGILSVMALIATFLYSKK